MLFLRFLVLFGLFLSSQSVFAYLQFQIPGYGATLATTHSESCEAFAKYWRDGGQSVSYKSSSDTKCYQTWMLVLEYGKPAEATERVYDLASSCYNSPVTSYKVPMSAVVASNGGVPPFPANYCDNKCVVNFDQATSSAYARSQDSALPATGNYVSCTPKSAPVGTTVSCSPYYIPPAANSSTCNLDAGTPPPCPAGNYRNASGTCVKYPVCTLPQVLDTTTNTCVYPACPSGTSRVTTGAACTPIACVPPMVRVGSVCQIPTCSAGETYEFKNGSGSCVVLANPCPSPKTLINGICQSPVCAAGTALNALGQCAASTGATSTASTSSNSPSLITSTQKAIAVTTTTSTGSTTTTDSTITTPVTGGSSGTGGAGTCTTPPCGACDPALGVCGTTFGGSCKEDFQCSGDAIQCAVAKATNKTECALKSIKVETENNAVYTEGQTAVDAGAGGAKRMGSAGGIAATEQSMTQVDKTNPFSSGCPADYSLATYKGTEIKIPLSKMCNIFEIMGKIMLACAGLICVRILTKED